MTSEGKRKVETVGLLSFLFGRSKSRDRDDDKGYYENSKDRWGLGREAAESHERWLDERSKDP